MALKNQPLEKIKKKKKKGQAPRQSKGTA